MENKSLDNTDNTKVCVIGIGYHGCQTITYMRQHHWFQDLPFKYVVVDNQPGNLNETMADELLLIETRLADNGVSNSVLIDASTQQKLDHLSAEQDCIFIVSALENDAISDLNKTIASYLYNPDNSLVLNIIIESESEYSQRPFLLCDCVIESSRSQIRRQLGKDHPMNIDSWYWPYQYQAACNITYGIIRTLFHKTVIGTDFANIRTMLQSRNEAKAVFVTAAGEDRAHQATEQALLLLQQEGWDLTDPELAAFMCNCIIDNDFSIKEFAQIDSLFSEYIPEQSINRFMVTFGKNTNIDDLGLFVLAVKDHRLNERSAILNCS